MKQVCKMDENCQYPSDNARMPEKKGGGKLREKKYLPIIQKYSQVSKDFRADKLFLMNFTKF